ncbi:MAG TPA: hypothetical protein VNO81_12780 [Candidatus Nitrosotenuis sp.]|nr:hypothetical protein [Candidatus Nitrosotenuis sp.]
MADAVLPISLAIFGRQYYDNLRGYKDSQYLVRRQKRRLSLELAAVLWRFLLGHEGCLRQAAGVQNFGLVTTVPSTSGRSGQHPLEVIVGCLCRHTAPRFRALLEADVPRPSRTPHGSLFRCGPLPRGENVLLIEDTWVTGSRAQSAAAALKRAGARAVGVVVLGRYLRSDWLPTKEYLTSATGRAFDWDRCCLEP